MEQHSNEKGASKNKNLLLLIGISLLILIISHLLGLLMGLSEGYEERWIKLSLISLDNNNLFPLPLALAGVTGLLLIIKAFRKS